MKTEHRYAEILKDMMSKMPLDSISVSALAKKAGTGRNTFYYHFHDIYDLLTQLFLDEKIEKIAEANTLDKLLEIIYNYYLKNDKFIEATLSSAGKDLFSEFIFNNCYHSLLRMINLKNTAKTVPPVFKKSIARFYASSISQTIVFYFANHRSKTLAGLKTSFLFLDRDFLDKALANTISNIYSQIDENEIK